MHKSLVNYHVSEVKKSGSYGIYDSTRIMNMSSQFVTEKQIHDWEDYIKQLILANDTFHDILEIGVEVRSFYKLDDQ